MERVLVTGSHGLVGLHAVPLLAKSREPFRTIGAPTPRLGALL